MSIQHYIIEILNVPINEEIPPPQPRHELSRDWIQACRTASKYMRPSVMERILLIFPFCDRDKFEGPWTGERFK